MPLLLPIRTTTSSGGSGGSDGGGSSGGGTTTTPTTGTVTADQVQALGFVKNVDMQNYVNAQGYTRGATEISNLGFLKTDDMMSYVTAQGFARASDVDLSKFLQSSPVFFYLTTPIPFSDGHRNRVVTFGNVNDGAYEGQYRVFGYDIRQDLTITDKTQYPYFEVLLVNTGTMKLSIWTDSDVTVKYYNAQQQALSPAGEGPFKIRPNGMARFRLIDTDIVTTKRTFVFLLTGDLVV